MWSVTHIIQNDGEQNRPQQVNEGGHANEMSYAWRPLLNKVYAVCTWTGFWGRLDLSCDKWNSLFPDKQTEATETLTTNGAAPQQSPYINLQLYFPSLHTMAVLIFLRAQRQINNSKQVDRGRIKTLTPFPLLCVCHCTHTHLPPHPCFLCRLPCLKLQ